MEKNNKMSYREKIEMVDFKRCYRTLELKKNPQSIDAPVTDEIVEKAYKNIKRQLEGMKNKKLTKENIEYLEEQEILIDEAYRTLNTEQKRSMYEEFCNMMATSVKQHRREKKMMDDMPKKIERVKPEKGVSQEEYIKKLKEYDRILKRMQESEQKFRKTDIDAQIMYKGEIGQYPPKRSGNFNDKENSQEEER